MFPLDSTGLYPLYSQGTDCFSVIGEQILGALPRPAKWESVVNKILRGITDTLKFENHCSVLYIP